MSLLKEYLNQKVVVITTEGHTLEGTLISFDKHTNIILNGCRARFSKNSRQGDTTETEKDSGNENVVRLLRGSEIVCIGLVDEALEETEINAFIKDEGLSKMEDFQLHRLGDTKNKVPDEFGIWKKVYALKKDQ